ncbi:MAG: glycosyltransferase family 2 protein [Actinobacteria bacterium]|nr:glycosyltransferase family 2 protein [Actinomycetota bacterium]
MFAEKLPSNSAHTSREPAVSVILTVVNEAAHLHEAIGAILKSNYDGEIEIAIAVGPSKDETEKIAQALAAQDKRIQVIANPSGRTPDGLNAALAATKNEIVVRIDGHSAIDSNYIREAVKILRETGSVNVGGVMAAEGVTPFEKAVARAMRSLIGVGGSRFHTGGSASSVDTVYLGVFQRSALQSVGGYDPRFTRAQDWELNFRLRKAGGQVWFDPRLQVTYRPRSSARALARQYFEYGRWRAAVSRYHKGTANFRYLAAPLNLILQLSCLLLTFLASPWFLIPPISYLVTLKISSLFIGKSWSERVRLPIVLIIMHFSWGIGFITSPRGLISNS